MFIEVTSKASGLKSLIAIDKIFVIGYDKELSSMLVVLQDGSECEVTEDYEYFKNALANL